MSAYNPANDPYAVCMSIGYSYQAQHGPHSRPGKHVAYDHLTGDLLVADSLDELFTAVTRIRDETARIAYRHNAQQAREVAQLATARRDEVGDAAAARLNTYADRLDSRADTADEVAQLLRSIRRLWELSATARARGDMRGAMVANMLDAQSAVFAAQYLTRTSLAVPLSWPKP